LVPRDAFVPALLVGVARRLTMRPGRVGALPRSSERAPRPAGDLLRVRMYFDGRKPTRTTDREARVSTEASSVVEVLKNSPVGTIDFKVDVVSVNKDQMAAVAAAIEKQDIAVEVAATGPKLGAAYSSYVSRKWGADEKKLIGKITLGDASVAKSAVGKAAIFHESVHALMDVKGLKISMHNDEVVAYLADALYLMKTSAAISGGEAEMAIYNAAFKIITTHKMQTKLVLEVDGLRCAA
jgi:hypothetical protein